MQISFDTEKEDVEQLKRILEILHNIILSKGGQSNINAQQNNANVQPSQPTPQITVETVPRYQQQQQPQPQPQQQPATSSIQARQAQQIFSYTDKIDMSKIYQSNAGIQKKREERYRHH